MVAERAAIAVDIKGKVREQLRLPTARGRNGQTRRPSSRKQDILADGQPAEVFEQGVLASEIGLVAPSAARRGPIIRPNIQDLASAFDPGMRAAIFLAQEQSASAGDGGPFGSVSRRLNENSEAAAHNRACARQSTHAGFGNRYLGIARGNRKPGKTGLLSARSTTLVIACNVSA